MIDPASLAFDIDGVVADTMTLFLDIARKEFDISGLRYENITSYFLEDCFDIEPEVLRKMIVRLLDKEHTSRLKPIKDAPEILTRLGRSHSPILFVTARPEEESIFEWITDMLSFEASDIEVIATGSFEAKSDILLNKGISYFIEDRLETCFLLNDAGINPVVFKQPWNRKAHPFVEVANWKEIESLIDF